MSVTITSVCARNKILPQLHQLMFMLPDELIIELLTEWLSLRDVARLDTAVCSRSLRTEFLGLLQRIPFPFSHTPLSLRKYWTPQFFRMPGSMTQKAVIWATLRKIKIKDYIMDRLEIPTYEKKEWKYAFQKLETFHHVTVCYKYFGYDIFDFLPEILYTCCHSLKVFTRYHNFAIDQTRMYDAMCSCKHLEVLELRSCKNISDLNFSKIGLLPKLKHLSFGLSNLLTDSSLHAIADGCHLLEKIKIRYGEHLTGDGIMNLCMRNPRLSELVLEDMSQLQQNDYMQIFTHIPMITRIFLHGLRNITDDSLIALASHCKFLTSISLDLLPRITDSSIAILALHCRFTEVSLCNNIGLTDASLLSFVAPCAIEKISIKVMPQFTDDALYELFSKCTLKSVHMEVIKKKNMTMLAKTSRHSLVELSSLLEHLEAFSHLENLELTNSIGVSGKLRELRLVLHRIRTLRVWIKLSSTKDLDFVNDYLTREEFVKELQALLSFCSDLSCLEIHFMTYHDFVLELDNIRRQFPNVIILMYKKSFETPSGIKWVHIED